MASGTGLGAWGLVPWSAGLHTHICLIPKITLHCLASILTLMAKTCFDVCLPLVSQV